MSYATDETGVETSRPREGIVFTIPGAPPWRLASGTRDFTIDGVTYTATTSARGDLSVYLVGGARELQIMIPARHPLVQRYMKNAAPPESVSVVVWRKQLGSGEAIKIWEGKVTSVSFSGPMANFLVPSDIAEAFQRRLPVITVGRQCPHVLYDAACKVDPTAYRIAANVIMIAGKDITVDSMSGMPDEWATYGFAEHVASGERKLILSQTGTSIVLQAPIGELTLTTAPNNMVRIYAGCRHDVTSCRSFQNIQNYGGFPELPLSNPHLPTGTGVIVQV